MPEPVTPVNISAAALIAQFCILIIMSVSAAIARISDEINWNDASEISAVFAWIILFFALVTMGCLVFSDEFAVIWKPLFGTLEFPAIPWSTALLIVFTLDIICVTILVAMTGGSRLSAFSPIFFILPSLAIFLRESLGRILFYLVLVAVSFSVTGLRGSTWVTHEESRQRWLSYWFVSIACLGLATFIGYITRPR